MSLSPEQDLRTALSRLESAGDLLRVKARVSRDYEVAAVLWRLARQQAVVFEDVDGHSVPVVGNLLDRRDKLATALGVPHAEIQRHVVAAMDQPMAPVVVPDAPWQQHQLPGDVDLSDLLPVPLISEGDAGRYISAGVLVTQHPETGRRNLAICRMQVTAPGRLGVYMAPTHSRAVLEAHLAAGTRMEVAVALGLHPAVLVASQFLTPLDETTIAGGLLGEPLQLTPARTVGLEVPTGAEIVLEGVIDPQETEEEGPFGEFPGTYAPRRRNPVIRLTAVSTRTSPLLQVIVGGRHPEHLVTGAIAREAGLLQAVRAVVPTVRAVRLTEGGTCRFHAVVSITKRFAGEGRLAMLAAFAAQDLIKHVVVVDDDIDVDDPTAVEWALATRMRAHEDLLVVPGMKSNPVDPMSRDRTITKLGVDATLPVGTPSEARVQVGVPASVMATVEARWTQIVGS